MQDAGYTRPGSLHELYDKALEGWERTGTQCDRMVQISALKPEIS